MSAPNLPPAGWLGPARQPTPGVVVLGRVLAFAVLGAVMVWGALLLVAAAAGYGVVLLSIMWGPPCVDGTGCVLSVWPGVGIGLGGCAVILLILAIALPVAWRRTSLLGWALVSLVIGVGTGVWAASTMSF